MASGIFAILDDVATLLDDTAVLSKVAAKKTAGLLGDDLAVNAEKATGFHASRELPVLWAITKGSLLNKIIILPIALALSAFAPWLIVAILLLGGAYLAYEGTEKVWEWLHPHASHPQVSAAEQAKKKPAKSEPAKIKAAIRTDFILSIEIIVIALDTVIAQSLLLQLTVVSLIALLATVGVYGLVALIVRMDDVGLQLLQRASHLHGTLAHITKATGTLLIASLPKVIRLLGVIGTVAMLLVGGGMYVHNINWLHHLLEPLPLLAAELLVGLTVGGLLLLAVLAIRKLRQDP